MQPAPRNIATRPAPVPSSPGSRPALRRATVLLAGALAVTAVLTSAARADKLLGDICRLKGQETNTLQGIGLVVGLNGTGDNSLTPTARSLARVMHLMGAPIGTDANGHPLTTEIEDAKNVALVAVTVELPGHGGREGDLLDCTVTTVGSAKSLQGGMLLSTPLIGPLRGQAPGQTPVYAFAQGPLFLEDKDSPGTARISRGCRLESDFFNPFVKDGVVTLVLDKSHAGFTIAREIEEEINKLTGYLVEGAKDVPLAKALDQANIAVRIPDSYRDDPVGFASDLLTHRIYGMSYQNRVVVNERTGVIVVGGDVELAAAAVTHNDMVVEVAGGQSASEFAAIDTNSDGGLPKLKALVSALNALHVSAKGKIEIIQMLDRQGAIFGQVTYAK